MAKKRVSRATKKVAVAVKAAKERAGALACPACHALFSVVANTIHADGEVKRYRRCLRCGNRFPTREIVASEEMKEDMNNEQ